MLRPVARLLMAPILVAAAISFAPLADAAAQRTFVASYGLTTNTAFNCSIAKPCRQFSDAMGVTNPGGEVIVLDSAGYGAVDDHPVGFDHRADGRLRGHLSPFR